MYIFKHYRHGAHFFGLSFMFLRTFFEKFQGRCLKFHGRFARGDSRGELLRGYMTKRACKV